MIDTSGGTLATQICSGFAGTTIISGLACETLGAISVGGRDESLILGVDSVLGLTSASPAGGIEASSVLTSVEVVVVVPFWGRDGEPDLPRAARVASFG